MDIDSLTQLSINLSNPDLDQSKQLKMVCYAIGDTIEGANRVSLWKFDENKTAINCIAMMADGEFSEPEGVVLSAEDYPEYFNAILESDVIRAPDARNHPHTMCFNKAYFPAVNVYSLLDYIFSNDFAPFGIICCESVGHIVEWSDQDLANLKRAARIVLIFSNIRNLA